MILVVLGAGQGQAAWEHGDYAVVFDAIGGAQWVTTCSDDHGGMLVGMLDSGATGSRVAVSRLNKNGTEMWGDGGRGIPFNLNTVSQEGPVAVASDGQGGAYVGYREVWPGNQHIVTVGHITAAGVFDWSQQIGDFLAFSPNFKVELIASAGDVIVIWSQNIPLPGPGLIAAGVDINGTELWEVQVADNCTLDPEATRWYAASDGFAGALIAFDRQPFMANREHRVARVDDTGTLLWGLNGTLLWQNFHAVAGVLHDGTGGAIVLNHAGYGEVWAQRVDSVGTIAWAAAGVQVLDLNLSLVLDQIGFCSNNGGGVIVATGLEDLYVQQVSFGGTRMWAGGSLTGVKITTLAGWQDQPSLCPDASGGAFIAYREHYYCDASDPDNKLLAGARINAGGTLLWSEQVLLWDGHHDSSESLAPQLVADGIGGALLAWEEDPYGGASRDVHALSIGPNAAVPAQAKLNYMTPDAGVPDSAFNALIHGTYLEPDLEFELRRDGYGSLPVAPMSVYGPGMLEVAVDLTGAEPGPWDLIVSHEGSEIDTLPALFGVGDMPPAGTIGLIDLPGEIELHGAGQRAIGFDSAGRAHAVYIEESGPPAYEYRVYLHTRSGEEDVLVEAWQSPPNLMAANPSLAVGPDDRVHVMFWESREPSGAVYQRYNPENMLEFQTFLPIVSAEFSLAVSDDGVAHFVADRGTGLSRYLDHWTISGDVVDGPDLLQDDAFSSQFDLIPYADNGLLLAFTRMLDDAVAQILLQTLTSSGASDPVLIWTGAYSTIPRLAWDGHEAVLLAFTKCDDLLAERILMTCKIVNGVPGPVVSRFDVDGTQFVDVAASGPDDFWLTASVSQPDGNVHGLLRRGDGSTFYPARRLHQAPGCWGVLLEASPKGVYASFRDYPGSDVHYYYCELDDVSAVPDDVGQAHGSLQTSPNPFNARTSIRFAVAQSQVVRLQVYDLQGRHVRTLVDGRVSAGDHALPWDGRDDRGADLASGVYLYRLEAGHRVEVSRGVLVK
jgi:hypothetical protein